MFFSRQHTNASCRCLGATNHKSPSFHFIFCFICIIFKYLPGRRIRPGFLLPSLAVFYCLCFCVLVGKVGRIVKITTWSSSSDLSQPSGHPTHNKTHRRQTKQVQTEQRQTYPEHKGTPRGSAQIRQLRNKPTNGAARHIPRGTRQGVRSPPKRTIDTPMEAPRHRWR